MVPSAGPFVRPGRRSSSIHRQPGADDFVGLVNVAVGQLELQPLGTSLLQTGAWPRRATSRCPASSPPSAEAPPWSLPAANWGKQCRPRCAPSRSWTAPRALPLIDRQGECASHADIVEWLLLVVWRDDVAAVPVALLDDDGVARLLHQFVARPPAAGHGIPWPARSARMASTRTDCLAAKMPTNPSRYG